MYVVVAAGNILFTVTTDISHKYIPCSGQSGRKKRTRSCCKSQSRWSWLSYEGVHHPGHNGNRSNKVCYYTRKYCLKILCDIFTSAEREVKDSRRSGIYQSWLFFFNLSSRYFEITSISLIFSLTFSRKEELLFWLSRGLNRLTCVTRQIRGDSKLRD